MTAHHDTGAALEAHEVNASDGRLSADVEGEVEKEEGDPHCPVCRTLHRRIDITTEVRFGSRS